MGNGIMGTATGGGDWGCIPVPALRKDLKKAMVMRTAARYVSRRLSSSVRNLIVEEKAAENVCIKKSEHEKLQMLARKAKASSNEIDNLVKRLQRLSKKCKKLKSKMREEDERYTTPILASFGFRFGVSLGMPYWGYIYWKEYKGEEVQD
ncbi:hypothetical protein BVC80_1449g2 [Macleaya cordata]|uniref:Uncharacterized protein n=1 Tax=Macleaya cordata TaxID=56857 RepID=A0A200RB97_MACCD|nr:hypothetical protein BVC80_1449g2 [Macleaya cordata]